MFARSGSKSYNHSASLIAAGLQNSAWQARESGKRAIPQERVVVGRVAYYLVKGVDAGRVSGGAARASPQVLPFRPDPRDERAGAPFEKVALPAMRPGIVYPTASILIAPGSDKVLTLSWVKEMRRSFPAA